MNNQTPIYSHNPYQAEGFPLLVLDVKRQICYPANEGFRVLHWHEELQFVYVKKGTIHVKIYEEEIDVSAGNCLFINRTVLHKITEKENCHYHSFIIPEKMLTFFPGSIMEHKEVHTLTHNPCFTHFLLNAKKTEYTSVFRKLESLDSLYFTARTAPHFEYRLTLALTDLWLEFISVLPALPENVPAKNHQRIHAMLTYIHASYSEPISADDIAAAANISKAECLRCFRAFTGDSPYQYLLKYRLHTSTSLLKNTDFSITDIAGKVGFNSTSSYIKYFQKYYGSTPYKYRIENAKIG